MDWNDVFDQSMAAGDILADFSIASPETRLYIGTLYKQSLDNYFVLPSTALFRRSLVPQQLRFPPNDPICGDSKSSRGYPKIPRCVLPIAIRSITVAIQKTCD